MKKLTHCTLALAVLSFSTISAMKANIVANSGSIRLTLGEEVHNFSLSENVSQECNGYSISLKKKEKSIKMKLSDKNNNNTMKLLRTENGDVYLYHTNWNSSLDISCNGTLNLLSYLKPNEKDSRKTFSCNRFEGKGNEVYIWGDVHVQNYWSFKGDTVCIAGRFRNKGANDVLNTPSKEQADNLKKNYLSKLRRGFWVLGTTDVGSLMTHNLNTHIVGTLQSPSLSQKGYARELSVGRDGFTDKFFADFNACYSREPKKETSTQFNTGKLSGAEKVTVNVKENTKVKIDNMDCRPEIIFKGNPNLEGNREGRKISIKDGTFEVNIGNIDEKINPVGLKLKVVQKKIEPSPKIESKSSKTIDKPCGITNMDNTCFANAAFQLLFSSEKMRNIYLSYKGENNFMKAMNTLVTTWEEKRNIVSQENIVSPKYLLPLVKDIWPGRFKKEDGTIDGHQHDSSEFLLHLLGKTEDILGKNLPFIGKETVTLLIENKGNFETKKQDFDSLTFRPEEMNSTKLSMLISSTDEEIQRYNTGKTYCKATKTTTRITVPECLFITIGREKYENGVLKKDETSIKIPEIFTLSDSIDYALKGIVRHSGNGNGGHYTAYTKFQSDWFYISDSSVQKQTNLETTKDTDSTILLYERVEKAQSK